MWLKKLQERLSAVDLSAVEGPQEKASTREQVLGVASDEAKRLWELRRQCHTAEEGQLAKFVSAHNTAQEHNSVHCAKLNKELFALQLDFNLLSALLWKSVWDQFGDNMVDGNLGIREGWKVTTWADDTIKAGNTEISPEIQDFLARLGIDPTGIMVVEEVPSGVSRFFNGLASRFARR